MAFGRDPRDACNGAAGFFVKLIEEGKDAPIPEFMSDHPDSGSRVDAVQAAAERLGCSTEPADPSRWRAFQASLPETKGEPDGEADSKE